MHYKTRNLNVQAIQFTLINAQDIATFIGGLSSDRKIIQEEDEYIFTVSYFPSLCLTLGDWVIKNKDGTIITMDDDNFSRLFQKCEEQVKVVEVMIFRNGMTAVFDENGHQIPRFQGNIQECFCALQKEGIAPNTYKLTI